MKNLLTMICLLIGVVLWGCKTPEWTLKPYNSVRWNDAETQVHAYLTTEDASGLKTDRRYTWFDKGAIGNTQGGYSGKLLHGVYTSWYLPSKQLKEKGEYVYGLKEGIWLYWAESGQIRETENWKKGVLVLPKLKRILPKRPLLKRMKLKDSLKTDSIKRDSLKSVFIKTMKR